MTPSQVIAEVRSLIQDLRTPPRYSDAVLLGFLNQTLKRMAVLRPDLFAVITDFATAPNTVLQSCPTDSIRFIEIFQVKDGDAVTEADRGTLDSTAPGWQNEAPGQPVNFMRHVRNPNKFFVYPRPSSGVMLVGEYAKTPITYTLGQLDTPIDYPSEAYMPVVVDGVVFLAESVDNEHVNSGRAKLFLESFSQALGTGLESRMLTDNDDGGLSSDKVI